MSVFTRSLRYVIRRPLRTAILFAVLLSMATALFASYAIKDATHASTEQVSKEFSSSFRLTSSVANHQNSFKGEGIIPQSAVDRVAALDGVEGHIAQAGAMALLPGSNLVSLKTYNEMDAAMSAEYGTFTQFEGTSDSSRNSKFALRTLTLAEGRHITPNDHHAALVHKDFAKLNGLSVGDTFAVKASDKDPGNRKGSTASVTVTVVGTFSGESSIGARTRQDLFQNAVLTDLTTIADLYGQKPSEQMFSDVDFSLAPGTDLQATLTQVKQLPIDWQKLDVAGNDQDLIGIAASTTGIMSMVDTMLVVTIGFSIAILALILFLWLHGRRREAGVMISVGIGKRQVLSQFACELTIIAIPAFAISALTGGPIAQAIGSKMATQSSASARQDIVRESGGMLAGDADTAALLKTIDTITVQRDATNLAWVFLVGMLVIACAVAFSSITLLRAKPRDLLSRMH